MNEFNRLRKIGVKVNQTYFVLGALDILETGKDDLYNAMMLNVRFRIVEHKKFYAYCIQSFEEPFTDWAGLGIFSEVENMVREEK